MNEMIIGSDELILWLRKNGRALNISNRILGKRILNLILRLGGSRFCSNQQSHWDSFNGAQNVNGFDLPKTSEQYLLALDTIPEVYRRISLW